MQNHRGTHKNISQLPKKEKILIPMILNARMYQKWEEKKKCGASCRNVKEMK